MATLPPDPFQSGSIRDRLREAKSFSRAECHDAIERNRREPYLQVRVRQAIIAQLKRIEDLEQTR